MSDADSVASTLAAPLAAGDEARGTVAEGPKLLANRYELLGMLGAGAMGTVYRARDRELEESVALKVLNQELASKDMLERFRREVKLARRVTHANVARTFDIGEHEGIRFLTMELIEGEMLASLLARKGRLQVPQVVRLAIDVCAGLTAAHAANVLHRDLKPENVIVAKDGRAVITDFGIARAVREGELARTMGGIVGTPAYMAPEQVEGSSDLDARADLYALGAMLYELLTGVMAWQGDTIVAVAAGRLLRPPPDARDVVESLPDDIAELVLRLMARRKEDRPESATEVVRQLGLLGGRASSSIPGRSGAPSSSRSIPALSTLRPRPGTRVIAVLPVLNLGTSEDAYLVDNVLEDLIDLLSVVPGLAVRPRGETVRFVDPARDVREIGRSVGSDVVVDGSFRRVGSSVRASFRLITVEDGFQLWARRFERPPSEVLSIADDAAHAIANALTAELRETKARSIDPETEELYLRGRFLFRRSWFDALGEAASVLERAYQRDPDDPRISGLLALTLSRIYGLPPNGRDVAERARVLANQALEVEPKQPEAQVALAILQDDPVPLGILEQPGPGGLQLPQVRLDQVGHDVARRVQLQDHAGAVRPHRAGHPDAGVILRNAPHARPLSARLRPGVIDRAPVLDRVDALAPRGLGLRLHVHPHDGATGRASSARVHGWSP